MIAFEHVYVCVAREMLRAVVNVYAYDCDGDSIAR